MTNERAAVPAPAADAGEQDPFDAWYEANAARFHTGQYSVSEIAYSAWYNAPQVAEAERDRLRAECERLRGAMPSDDLLSRAATEIEVGSSFLPSITVAELRTYAAAISRSWDSATPQPAEAVTGGEALAALDAHLDTGESVVLGRDPITGARQVSIAGRTPSTVEAPTLLGAILAALDQDQEADHAAQ